MIKRRLYRYGVCHSTPGFACNECKDCSVVRPFKAPSLHERQE